nr:uncharacterized protein LOC118097570 [Zootoca vivipara]
MPRFAQAGRSSSPDLPPSLNGAKLRWPLRPGVEGEGGEGRSVGSAAAASARSSFPRRLGAPRARASRGRGGPASRPVGEQAARCGTRDSPLALASSGADGGRWATRPPGRGGGGSRGAARAPAGAERGRRRDLAAGHRGQLDPAPGSSRISHGHPMPTAWDPVISAAARSETTPKGAEGQPAASSRATSPAKGPRNQQQLHRELLFTHRKGLSLRSKPELLQVLEHRNRRRDGVESGVEQSSLEQELLRRQQRREQNQQQEETGDTLGNQPEFIQVRENLRRTHYPRDPPPLRAAPPPISTPFLRPHLTNRQPSRISATRSSVVPKPPAPQPQGSLKGSSLSSAPHANT